MATKDYSNTVLGRLNTALLGWISTGLQIIGLGAVIRSLRTFKRNMAPDATLNAYVIQTGAQSITLPESAKAAKLKYVYARGGTGTKGALTVDHGLWDAVNTAPAAGHCAVGPTGDLLFASADAWTILDYEYEPEKYDVYEITLPVVPATGLCALPAALVAKGVIFMMEAEALVGTTTGKKVVQVPADSAPSTGLANLKIAKDNVYFATADAVTSARLKFAVASAIDVDAVLEGTSTAV